MRTSICESYYKLKYRSDSASPTSNQLNEELDRLRESTRKSLQQSWDEAEALQEQCLASDESLIQMEEEKKTWEERCLKAEAKLKKSAQQSGTLQYRKRRSVSDSVMSWTSKKNNKENSNKAKDDIDVLEQGLKVSSRDDAISTLEQTLIEKLKSMQSMETEMQNLIEKQRIKEKKLHESHTNKEERLNLLVDSLREELANAKSRKHRHHT